MSGELPCSSAAGPDPSSSSTAALPPDVTPSTTSSQSTDATKLNTLSRAMPEIKHRQARPSQSKPKMILSDGDLSSIIDMISKLEPYPGDGGQSKGEVSNTRTAPQPVELDSTSTRHQEGKTVGDHADAE